MRSARGPRINGHALEAFRQRAGKTQVELASAAGVCHSHISRLESGQRRWPSLRVTRALAEALGVPVSALLASEHEDGQQ